MRDLFQKLRAWYRRRFRGYVAPPARHAGRGTSWQEHRRDVVTFICRGSLRFGQLPTCACMYVMCFTEGDYVIRKQRHRDGCDGFKTVAIESGAYVDGKFVKPKEIPTPTSRPCDCPVTDARYVKICPQCGLGHWKPATAGRDASSK
jgi:hypothetical protein